MTRHPGGRNGGSDDAFGPIPSAARRSREKIAFRNKSKKQHP
jgi:hypothetical protein